MYKKQDLVIERIGEGRQVADIHVKIVSVIHLANNRLEYLTSTGNRYNDVGLRIDGLYGSIRHRRFTRKVGGTQTVNRASPSSKEVNAKQDALRDIIDETDDGDDE